MSDVQFTNCVNEPMQLPPLISWILFILFCDFDPSFAPKPQVFEQVESSDHSVHVQFTIKYGIDRITYCQ